jgi:hypothetical protein
MCLLFLILLELTSRAIQSHTMFPILDICSLPLVAWMDRYDTSEDQVHGAFQRHPPQCLVLERHLSTAKKYSEWCLWTDLEIDGAIPRPIGVSDTQM